MSECTRCGWTGPSATPNCPRCGQPFAPSPPPPPPRPTLILRVEASELPSDEFEVTDASQTIGRQDDADITIPHKSVSRQHARIAPTPTGFEIEDLGSTNGTYVNDRPISDRTPLAHNDLLLIGDVPVRVILRHAPAPIGRFVRCAGGGGVRAALAATASASTTPASALAFPERPAPATGPSTVYYDLDEALAEAQVQPQAQPQPQPQAQPRPQAQAQPRSRTTWRCPPRGTSNPRGHSRPRPCSRRRTRSSSRRWLAPTWWPSRRRHPRASRARRHRARRPRARVRPAPTPALDPLPTPARDPAPTPALDPLPTPPREATRAQPTRRVRRPRWIRCRHPRATRCPRRRVIRCPPPRWTRCPPRRARWRAQPTRRVPRPRWIRCPAPHRDAASSPAPPTDLSATALIDLADQLGPPSASSRVTPTSPSGSSTTPAASRLPTPSPISSRASSATPTALRNRPGCWNRHRPPPACSKRQCCWPTWSHPWAPRRRPTMNRSRMRPIWSQSPERSSLVVPGWTTRAPAGPTITSGLRPRWATLHAPALATISACRRCTDSLPTQRPRSTSRSGEVRPEHVRPTRRQPEAHGSLARVAQQQGITVADRSELRSATLIANLRVARKQRSAPPIEAMQLQPLLAGRAAT